MLAFGSGYVVSADDTLQFDAGLTSPESADNITWPMLPGESIKDLARMFYPKNQAMQKQFVTTTLRLNSETQANLKASERFDVPTLLVVPTLKSLSKNAVKANKKSKRKSLKMSYGLKRLVQLAPEKLLQEYEELVSKNAFLKEQLIKLNEKIVVLQAKLDDLKLIFDKTLSLPNSDLPASNDVVIEQVIDPAQAVESGAPMLTENVITPQPATKKVFKNLNQIEKQSKPNIEAPNEVAWFDNFNTGWAKAVLMGALLLLLGAFGFKKYQQGVFDKSGFAAGNMQNTVTDFSGYFEKSEAEVESPVVVQQVQAAKAIESRLSATLEEAKLLMSVNRTTDAIAHLKMTISSQPKVSINHWLYLLEVFRKLNLKAEFEEYANGLHETFNVMTPVWYEKEAAVNTVMVVPQSLEEFPHIMEQLYGVWPGELAIVYLRSLVHDNRGGERVGFGKAVVLEILFLIELLDTLAELPT